MKNIETERLLELLVYSLLKNTEVYNHELATNTLKTMKIIIEQNLYKTTDELTELLLDYWDNMDKYNLFKSEVYRNEYTRKHEIL